jgi:hypothetical protein
MPIDLCEAPPDEQGRHVSRMHPLWQQPNLSCHLIVFRYQQGWQW